VLQGLQQIRLLRNAGVGLTGSSVFEHITPEVIEEIIWQCGRILRPQGAMCHIMDKSDHWEHDDKSISRLNFLRYEDGWFWRIACFNPQNYQNRLRHPDYLAMFHRCGWESVVADGEPDEKALRGSQNSVVRAEEIYVFLTTTCPVSKQLD